MYPRALKCSVVIYTGTKAIDETLPVASPKVHSDLRVNCMMYETGTNKEVSSTPRRENLRDLTLVCCLSVLLQ